MKQWAKFGHRPWEKRLQTQITISVCLSGFKINFNFHTFSKFSSHWKHAFMMDRCVCWFRFLRIFSYFQRNRNQLYWFYFMKTTACVMSTCQHSCFVRALKHRVVCSENNKCRTGSQLTSGQGRLSPCSLAFWGATKQPQGIKSRGENRTSKQTYLPTLLFCQAFPLREKTGRICKISTPTPKPFFIIIPYKSPLHPIWPLKTLSRRSNLFWKTFFSFPNSRLNSSTHEPAFLYTNSVF